MNRQYISIYQLAQQVILKKSIRLISESAAGLIPGVQSRVVGLGQELKKAGIDATDLEVQAALLLAALEGGGKLEKVAVQDAESIGKQIQEARGYTLLEIGGSLLHTIELAGNLLGNVALMNIITKSIETITGKKVVDPKKMTIGINKMATILKKLTGLPAKALEKFFKFISAKMGGGPAAQKVAGYVGTTVVVVAFFALGTLFFPVLGASPLMIVLSLTGLIGKGFEIKTLWKHIVEAILDYKKEKGQDYETLPDIQLA